MKKKLILLSLAFLLFLNLFTFIPTAAENGIEVLYDNITIYHNNTELKMTDANGNFVEPFIIDGTTYVPLRSISQSFDMGVTWNADENYIKIVQYPKEKNTPSDKPYIKNYQTPGLKVIDAVYSDIAVYANQYRLEASPIIFDGTTFVPVRAASEVLYKTVNWDAQNKRVIITDENPGYFLPPDISSKLVKYSNENQQWVNTKEARVYLEDGRILKGEDQLLRLFDSDGNELWTCDTKSKLDFIPTFTLLDTGEFVVLGSENRGDLIIPVLTKINFKGEIVFQKTFEDIHHGNFNVLTFYSEIGLILELNSELICLDSTDFSVKFIIPDSRFSFFIKGEFIYVCLYIFDATEERYVDKIVKFDKNGNELLEIEIDNEMEINSIAVLEEDQIIISFTARSSNSFQTVINAYNQEGELLRHHVREREYFAERAFPTTDGGLITLYGFYTNPNERLLGYTVTKFDKDLNLEWRKSFEDVHAVVPLEDGSLFVKYPN